MSIKSAQAVTVIFTTQNPTTGAAADASSTPTGTLYVNGTANAASVTVTNITTGLYKAAVTLPSLTAGDIASLRISATVATIAGEGVVWQDVSDTKRTSDLQDVAATAIVSAGAITTSSGAVTTVTNLTNAPTAGDLTATMKTSVTTAATAATPTAAAVTGAVGSVTGAVGSVTGAVGSVTGNVGGNVVGSVASVANIAPTGTGLTAIPWNASWDAEVQSEAQDAITASALATAAAVADLPTNAELTTALADLPTNAELATALGTADDAVLAAIAALNNLSSAGAQSAAAAALTAYGAALQSSVDDLEGRLTATRAGYLDNLSAGAVATAAALTAVDDYVDSEVAAIKAVTDKIDTALVLDGAVYQLTANALELAPTGGSAPTAAQIRAEMDSNSTQLAAIVADTGTDIPATLANLATASALTTVAGYIDTEVAAILVAVDTEIAAILEDTGTTLPATLANLATTAAVAAVKAILDKLDTALELDGAVYRYTINALEQAPAGGGGGGGTDWTTGEKEQIRHRLGVDGDAATPASNAPHLGTVDANVVEISGDATAADNLESYADGTLPFPAHVTTIRR